MSIMSIKIKLLELGKKQIDLLFELRERGCRKLQPSELSLILSGKLTTPKAEHVLAMCNDIIDYWESIN